MAAFLACGGKKVLAETIEVTKEVRISVDGGKIAAVTPRIAILKEGGLLILSATGLGDSTLEIDFNVVGNRKGPFRPGKGLPRGRFTLSSAAPKVEAVVDARRDSGWKYEVVLRDRAGVDLDGVDPMIIIQQ
jgi:hypothetical protein